MLLDGSEDDTEMLFKEVSAVLHHVRDSTIRHGSTASDRSHMCAQTIYSVLDHMTKWTRHRLMVLSIEAQKVPGSSAGLSSVQKPPGGSSGSTTNVRSDPCYVKIKTFLDRVPQDVLARASYNCGAYTRAFMHHEQFIKASPVRILTTVS